jgi:hypothetical protein
MGHRHPQGDPTKALPADGVGHLTAQGLEAQAIAVLQEHQPQVGLDGKRWATERSIEVGHEGLEKCRIVEETVHPLQLGGHPEAHLGEDGFPQCGLRV